MDAYDTDAECEECDPTENELSYISNAKLGSGIGG